MNSTVLIYRAFMFYKGKLENDIRALQVKIAEHKANNNFRAAKFCLIEKSSIRKELQAVNLKLCKGFSYSELNGRILRQKQTLRVIN